MVFTGREAESAHRAVRACGAEQSVPGNKPGADTRTIGVADTTARMPPCQGTDLSMKLDVPLRAKLSECRQTDCRLFEA